MEKLECLLCRGSYRSPHMCSHCSSIFCKKCITEYLQQNHVCPHCGQILPEMANCGRLIDEIKQHITTKKSYIKECKVHKMLLKYYCSDCQRPICADCGIIDPKHKNHTVALLEDTQLVIPKGRLRQYLVTIEEIILRDHGRYEQLSLEKEVLRSEVRWCRNRLREFYQEMSGRLEREADKMMSQIFSDMVEKEGRITRLQKVKEDISQILQLGEPLDPSALERISPSNQIMELLMDQEAVIKKLDKILEDCKEDTYFHFNRKSLTTLYLFRNLSNQVYPEYQNHTEYFDYSGNETVQIAYGEVFKIHGQEWRLKINPHGNQESPGYLSLFLQMLNTPPGTSQCLQYYFRLELISLNEAGKTISKEYRSPFMPGDCWGYHDFVPLSSLEEYLHNGHLILGVGVRNCSYYDVTLTLNRYVRKLEQDVQVLEELMTHSNQNEESNIDEVSSLDVVR